jgi:hypothetical protein
MTHGVELGEIVAAFFCTGDGCANRGRRPQTVPDRPDTTYPVSVNGLEARKLECVTCGAIFVLRQAEYTAGTNGER